MRCKKDQWFFPDHLLLPFMNTPHRSWFCVTEKRFTKSSIVFAKLYKTLLKMVKLWFKLLRIGIKKRKLSRLLKSQWNNEKLTETWILLHWSLISRSLGTWKWILGNMLVFVYTLARAYVCVRVCLLVCVWLCVRSRVCVRVCLCVCSRAQLWTVVLFQGYR